MAVELTPGKEDSHHNHMDQDKATESRLSMPGNEGLTDNSQLKISQQTIANVGDDTRHNAYNRWLISTQQSASQFYTSHAKVIWTASGIVLAVAYMAYFGYAMYYKFGDEGSWRLLGFTVLGAMLFALVTLCRVHGTQLDKWWDSTEDVRHSSACHHFSTFIKWFLRVGVLVMLVVYVLLDIALDNPGNLLTVAGLAIFLLVFYVTSVNPAKVNWHTVYWGMALQYVFALLILRTTWGYHVFEWMGDRVTGFMSYADAGALFVFGPSYEDHFFVMKVMPIGVFFFSVINILMYLGVIQAIVRVIGSFLAFCMGTTPAESLSAASNIFLGIADSPVMIRPFLKDLTKSELHAIMTGGFATIAGSVLGAYISFGVPANHLISASVMSAPAALAISKLSCPETEKSAHTSDIYRNMEKPPERNIIEAASNGATMSIKLIANITTNVIAFLSMLAFFNASLTWFGSRAGVDGLTFELICSYVLYPLSYFMGVETADCGKVAELVGVKTFTNEFIAYTQLKDLINNRHSLENYTEFYNTTGWHWNGGDVVLNITGDVLTGGVMSVKSEVIATYALCGFANFGSIGITLGTLGALAPTRKSDISDLVLRAMICGNVACFLTACVAGLLYKPI